MFKLMDEPAFDWNVDVGVPAGPGEDGENAIRAERFVGRFVALPIAEVQAPDRDIAEILRRAWRGWRDVQGEDGEPVPFSEAVRDRMLEIAYVRLAVWSAYLEALLGGARRGN